MKHSAIRLTAFAYLTRLREFDMLILNYHTYSSAYTQKIHAYNYLLYSLVNYPIVFLDF